MNKIQQFIQQNEESIEAYDTMEEQEKAQFESKFKTFARANKAEMGTFLREAEFYNDLLEVIYSSFYDDPEWEQLFISEVETMIKDLIKNPPEELDDVDNFSKLESMGLSKIPDGLFGKKILGLLVKQIDHSDPYISHKFLIVVASYWITSIPDSSVIEKLKLKLSDTNWQIRWLVYDALTSPVMKQYAGDVSIPFSDKVKYFFRNYFGDPKKPEK
jgi:hypothetical protein